MKPSPRTEVALYAHWQTEEVQFLVQFIRKSLETIAHTDGKKES
ncbi:MULTISPECIES: hypothetical protein [unclassified Helicobacter]|nr:MULTISPECIES: hypothetical protein [unclassified Helicobacter]